MPRRGCFYATMYVIGAYMKIIEPIQRFCAHLPDFSGRQASFLDIPSNDAQKETRSQALKYEPITNSSARFAKCFERLMRHEGGYVDLKSDAGGKTNMGVTFKTLARWRGVPASTITKADMLALTKSEAMDIAEAIYWDACRCDDLPPGLDYAVFDFAFNSGPVRASKYLQKIVGAKADGIIGKNTLRAVHRKKDIQKLISRYLDDRIAFMKRSKNPNTGKLNWPNFGRGWAKRVREVRVHAHNDYSGGGGGW